jgi:ornithine cyclodeaminase
VLDGTYVTATRTAAGSALATKLLARPGSAVVSIIATGVQGRTHARALSGLAGTKIIRVAGRDPEKAVALTEELVRSGIPAEAAISVEDAVWSADVVCCATHASEPVVRREWLRGGTHINSVGYNTEGAGEIDIETIRDAVVVVESRAAVLAAPPSGAIETRRAIESGAIDADHIHAEIGQLVAGKRDGRQDNHQLTVYKSGGVAVQDVAAATLVLEAARRQGVGTLIDL